jgi:hypothetical protein
MDKAFERVLVGVGALSLAGCSLLPQQQVDSDYLGYPTVEELAMTADVVVSGSVAGVRGKELDGGGDDESTGRGLEMIFYDFSVDDVLAGTGITDRLVVAWAADEPGIESGSTVLFLRHLTSADAPGIASEDDFYVPVSGRNGVFDLEGTELSARAPDVVALTVAELGSAPSRALAATDAADFRASLRAVTRTVSATRS